MRPQADLQLLCPTGGCKSVDEYATCNFAKVPAHAIVGPRLYQTSSLGAAIKAALVNAGWCFWCLITGRLLIFNFLSKQNSSASALWPLSVPACEPPLGLLAGDNVPGFLEATRELGGQANFVFGATTQALKVG